MVKKNLHTREYLHEKAAIMLMKLTTCVFLWTFEQTCNEDKSSWRCLFKHRSFDLSASAALLSHSTDKILIDKRISFNLLLSRVDTKSLHFNQRFKSIRKNWNLELFNASTFVSKKTREEDNLFLIKWTVKPLMWRHSCVTPSFTAYERMS